MSVQIYQIEKSQAIDLLDRISNRMLDQSFRVDWDDDNLVSDGCDAVMALCRDIDRKSTELSNKNMTFANVMEISGQAEELRGSVVGFMARHLSNYNVDPTACLLAAGYALPERYKLCYEENGGEVNWQEDEGRL